MHQPLHDPDNPGAALPGATASLNEQWRAFQLKLSDELKSLRSPEDIVRTATMLLAAYLDASHCWYTEIGADGATFHTRGGWFQPDMPPIPASGRIADFGPELVTTMRAGHDFIADDLQTDPRTAAYAQDYALLRIGALLVAPLFKDGRWVANLNVATPAMRYWTADDVLVVRDVAERTWSAVENALAQAALCKERDRSQHIFDTMTEGFVLVDADEALVYVNGAAARIAGAPLPDLRGRRFWDVFPDLIGTEVEALYRRVRAGGRMEAIEFHRILDGGASAWMEIRVYPALDDGLAVFFDDITARKETILATQQAEAYKTMLLELGDRLRGVADDPAAMMRVATEELARILDVPRVGYVSMDEAVEYGVVGHNYNDVSRVPDLPARRERLDDYGLDLAADLRAGRVMRVTDLVTDPRTAGEAARAHAEIGARASIAAPIQVGGKTVAFMFAHHDKPRAWTDADVELMRQTAARTWEAVTRARAAFALRENDRRKDEFLAMLAHELRNPLAPISSAAELLRLGRLDAERVGLTSAIISRQVKHMVGLIDDLLDVSRVTRGLVTLDLHEIDARTVVAAAVEQVKPLIEARAHCLTIGAMPQPAPVNGDLKRLVQCLANGLANAAKYTPEGGAIGVELQASERDVVITVSDNGIGMTQDVLAHAFALFVQAERASDRSQGGLGIGLALVKRLVELHGGTIALHSAGLGQGSRFVLTLPRSIGQDGPLAELPPASSLDSPGRRLRIMVVDDNVDAAEVLAALCRLLGHDVVVEASSARALVRARTERPDVCLIDIGLPDMNGNELARRLRSQPETARTALAAVTGYGQEQDRAAAREAGFDEYFVKPVDVDRIAAFLVRS